jgi:choline monooxygenase
MDVPATGRDARDVPAAAGNGALAHASALAVEHYVDPRWAAAERTAVFARSWQLVGDAARVAQAGDHAVDEIAGHPLLAVRGGDGRLRAFANVCRHRAGPLALADGRGARGLRCRYHGWTYDLDGRLRAAPEMDDACAFDRAAIALPALRAHEWNGLLFVAIDAGTPAFDEVYAGVDARLAPAGLRALRFAGRDRYEVACNWKVYVDNFLEGYHLPHVHPGLSRALDYRGYTTELARWHSLQHAPLRDGALYGDGAALYFFVWPNVMLNVTPGRLQTNRVLPLGVDRCAVEFDWYFAADGGIAQRAAADRAFSDEVQREDARICEAVQKGLASGHYRPGRLSPAREAAVWHFHELLRAAYASA